VNTLLPTTETGTDLDYLDPATTSIEPASAGAVRLLLHDRCYPRAIAVWAFPFTDRTHWIALRDTDDKPIGMLKDSDDLDKDSQTALNAALERRYFVPRIQKVKEAREEFGLLTMAVETDRGNVAFTINNPRENIHWIGPHRILFVDAEENRYEVMNHDELDSRSQVLLANVI
jgi:hypothetical protein